MDSNSFLKKGGSTNSGQACTKYFLCWVFQWWEVNILPILWVAHELGEDHTQNVGHVVARYSSLKIFVAINETLRSTLVDINCSVSIKTVNISLSETKRNKGR